MTLRLPRLVLTLGLVITVALALVAIALGQSAQASGLTLHNNYGSDRIVTARDSAGRTHYIEPGTTDSMGSSYTIYVGAWSCDRYGWPSTGAIGRSCATWTTSRSLWVDVVATAGH